jgi:hypothetical protein
MLWLSSKYCPPFLSSPPQRIFLGLVQAAFRTIPPYKLQAMPQAAVPYPCVQTKIAQGTAPIYQISGFLSRRMMNFV